MNYWKSYNEKLQQLSNKMNRYNLLNSFNYVEDSFYNHVRDIVAITIAMNQKSKQLNILDFGSNITAWSNMLNKINLKNISITIYDPFSNGDSVISINETQKIKIIKEIESLQSNLFDITIFASVSQYIEDFFQRIQSYDSIMSSYVIFTHTPLSIEEDFISKQNTNFKGAQIIRSFQNLKQFMEDAGYNLIFKSTLNPKFASVDEEFIAKVVYANLIFKKN